MGKTHAITSYANEKRNTSTPYHHYDLATFNDINELKEEIFKSDWFLEWVNGTHVSYLLLDSLDEAKIEIPKITYSLERVFNKHKYQLSRLNIRIVCRLADWPKEFEGSLKELWGEEQYQTYILNELEAKDIDKAAIQALGDELSAKFVEEVRNKGLESFVSRPLTLKFLLDIYQSDNKLPQTRQEIYERGCKKLCQEISKKHQEQDKVAEHSRYVIAARIMAMMVFAGHNTISLVHSGTNHLQTEDLTGGGEKLKDLELPYIQPEDVRETLETALFQGSHTLTWAHKTYAEFLAAYYVAHKLTRNQIKDLIFHPEGQLVPQLREVAAWIVSFKPELAEDILASDPEILLKSDIAINNEPLQDSLTIALLEWRNNHPFKYFEKSLIGRLKTTSTQHILKTFLADKHKHFQARDLALEIAIACQQTGLQEVMIEIALDVNEAIVVRNTAAEGILLFDDDIFKQKLKPLALLGLEDRFSGELKRYGILATWPRHLAVEELFSTLVIHPRGERVLDRYTFENWQTLIMPYLSISNLPVALSWVANQPKQNLSNTAFFELTNEILLMAWRNIDGEEVLEAFCHTCIAVWSRHDSIDNKHNSGTKSQPHEELIELVQSSPNKRFLFLEKILPMVCNHQYMGWVLIHDIPYLSFDDAKWLCDYFERCSTEQERAYVISLLYSLVRIDSDPKHFEFIYKIGQEKPDLWSALNYTLEIPINSPRAELDRSRLRQEKEWAKEDEEPQKHPLTPSPKERVLEKLNAFQQGDLNAWWHMSFWLQVNVIGYIDNNFDFEFNCALLPVWELLNDDQKEQIVSSAKGFLISFNPNQERESKDWQKNPKKIYRPIIAGCRAFFLIALYDTNWLQKNSIEHWIPALTYSFYRSLRLIYRNGNESISIEENENFLKLLYSLNPEKVNKTYILIAEQENEQENNSLGLPEKLENLWNSDLTVKILHLIAQGKIKPDYEFRLLRAIEKHSPSVVAPILQYYLQRLPDEREKSLKAAQILCEVDASAGWEFIWPIFSSDDDWAKDFIQTIASPGNYLGDMYISHLTRKLTPKSLADLTIWLFKHYPPIDKPLQSGFLTLTDNIESLQRQLPERLAEIGTKECSEQLTRIQQAIGVDLSYRIDQAQEQYLTNSWEPLSPANFKKLINGSNASWVQNGSQLLDVLQELLEKLTKELQGTHGATPRFIELWNENPNRPKDENRLSDYVENFLKRHLGGKNVFIGRENQIRRGSETDIYIEAKNLGSNETIRAVIEVKGCWHKELKTAMQAQLHDRYLAQNGIQHGIYLIGRFLCSEWDNNDSRKKQSPKKSNEELKSFYEQQAQALSQNGVDIRAFLLDVTYT